MLPDEVRVHARDDVGELIEKQGDLTQLSGLRVIAPRLGKR